MAYDINAIYQDLFGRQADPDGLAYWQQKAPGIVAESGVEGLRAQIGGTATPADQTAMFGQMNNPNTYGYQISQIYQDQFGRAPDAEGYAYWLSKAPGIAANGGIGALRDQIIGTAAPADAAYNTVRQMAPGANNLTQAEAVQWNDYMNRAANEQRGMNAMPFVAPSSGQYTSMSPEDIYASLFRNADEQKAAMDAAQTMWGTPKDEKKKKDGGLGGLGGFGAEGLLGSKM